MTEPVKVGDPITIASPMGPRTGRHPGGRVHFDWRFCLVRVTWVGEKGFHILRDPPIGSVSPIPYADEGIWWCRGHEGAAVDALKTACALR